MKKPIWIGLLLIALGLQGCAVTWTGHQVPINSLDGFRIGETTQANVESLLGKPEKVLVQPERQITIYVYQSLTNVSVGFKLPILALGRGKQTGFILKIFFSDGVFMNYELTELNQRLLL